ncbi:hypothetical protein F2Q70_00026018 [Brassica cretica]|uniref:Uncharacterized protein n=1 Tax=Brassica cretica TaxID=69181 RepID=A0A8S9LFH5_BRACR|nr:hypothetical protein F2Q70_00026018 [Brassica cretica]
MQLAQEDQNRSPLTLNHPWTLTSKHRSTLDSHHSKIGYNRSNIGLMVFTTPLRDSVDSLTTRLDVFQHEMDTIQTQLKSRAEPSPSIDRRTRASIDDNYAALRNKLVTEKSLDDKLDEITFSQDLLKEDVYQKLKDNSESTYARLEM